MSICPICGKPSDNQNIEFNGKIIHNTCTLCSSYAKCLRLPVSPAARESSKEWANNVISTHPDPYVKDTINELLQFSDTVAGSLSSSSAVDKHTRTPDVQNLAGISLTFTSILQVIIAICFVIEVIAGLIAGGSVGLLIGLFAGFLTSIVGLVIIEISKNVASLSVSLYKLDERIRSLEEKLENTAPEK